MAPDGQVRLQASGIRLDQRLATRRDWSVFAPDAETTEAAGLADTVLGTHPVRESTLKDHHHFNLGLVNMDRWSATDHECFRCPSEARSTAHR